MSDPSSSLRAITYLAPSIPVAFFAEVTGYLGRVLGRRVALQTEIRKSGPMHGDHDPFASGSMDLGFVCSPSYLYLMAQRAPSVQLVPAAFVFADPRHKGQPVYYSELIVRVDDPAERFEDLAGRVWGYNDECSLSGHFAAEQKVAELGCGKDFFLRQVRTGSHLESLQAVLSGQVDAAAIDSVALGLQLRNAPQLRDRLRILGSLGPFPIQPMVVRSALGAAFASQVANSLLAMHEDPTVMSVCGAFGLQRCVTIDDQAYQEERRALQELGEIPGAS